ncbi:MAG: ABC transporter permease subunit [Planctomycetales bacterium]|nr:ABC transporter permease subunit [Planctomycetales bacterium]
MIRPYLAILKDSFRESMASRVLWLLLAAITCTLMALAMIHIEIESDWQLSIGSVPRAIDLARSIVNKSDQMAPSVEKKIWTLLDADEQSRWRKWFADEGDRVAPVSPQEVIQKLNALIERDDLYDPVSWATVRMNKETRELAEGLAGKPTTDFVTQANRRLLEAGLSGFILPSRGESFYLEMLAWRFPETPIADNRDNLERIVNIAVMVVMDLVMGLGGILVAILVTAGMVPRTFEDGSIDLLLSKPISRALLYVTKYLGGCIFILVNATFFLVGLWFLLGLRCHVWNHRVLWCIPLYVFLFGVYYAVSALAGVIWRNAIISVAMSVLFWFACFSVGSVRSGLSEYMIARNSVQRLASTPVGWLGVSRAGAPLLWSDDSQTWQEVMPYGGPGPEAKNIVGPVYNPASHRLIGIPRESVFNPRASRFLVATADNQWKSQQGAESPPAPRRLLRASDGRIIVVGQQGIYAITGDVSEPPRPTEPAKILGIRIPLPQPAQSNVYTSVGPVPWVHVGPYFDVSMRQRDGALAFYDSGHLHVLIPDEQGRYPNATSLDIDTRRQAMIGFAADRAVVADEEGKVFIINTETMSLVKELELSQGEAPRHVAMSPDGKLAIVEYHDNKLGAIDVANGEPAKRRLPRHEGITSVTFLEDGTLAWVDERRRVSEVDLDRDDEQRVATPVMSVWERAYYYLFDPLYRVFPKPGELDSLVMYVLTGETTMNAVNPVSDNLDEPRIVIDVWGPLRSTTVFTVGVLLLGCVYVYRRDF